MPTRYVYLVFAALLASFALGAPHDEDNTLTSMAIDQSPPTGRSTTTVTVTSTYTSYPTEEPSHETGSYASGFAIPPSPGSVTAPSHRHGCSSPTGTTATLTCLHPTEPCIINGIPIWPSGTTSLVLPSFTYDPLPTSMASGLLSSVSSAIMTEILATSGSPAGASITSTMGSHTMSQIVPGSPSSDLPWTPELPYITHSRSLVLQSGISTNVPSRSNTSGSATRTAVSGSDTSEFYWPTTPMTSSSSATSSIASISGGSTASIPPPEISTTDIINAGSSLTPAISARS
jgi:hypothetical protein